MAVLFFVAVGCGFKSDEQWRSELGGKQLSKAKTSGSMSDRVDIWFCSNGEYARRIQFSGLSTGGGGTLSMADEDFEIGKWRVENSTLILQPDKGERSEYSIFAGASDVIQLNGNDYLIQTQKECR